MGWLETVKNYVTGKRSGLVHAGSTSGRTPIYSAFGSDVYASDVVSQAVACVVDEIRKLAPVHVVSTGEDLVPQASPLQRVLNSPNHYMTTGDMLARVMRAYFSDKSNAWIVPTYTTSQTGRRTYTGLYPIDPATVTFMEDVTGRLFVELRFNGEPEPWVIPYSDIIHLRRNYGVDEYMGGGLGGRSDDRGLLATLEINHQMLRGMGKAARTSQAINGVVKYGTVIDKERTEKAARDFEEKLENSQSGLLVMDQKAEYLPLKRDLKLVDAETLRFIDEKILRNFGVPLCIMIGDYTKEQYEAFYQKTIEPIIIQLSQEFTRVLFTLNESGSYGHKVQFFAKELVFMSIDQKIKMVDMLAPTGALYENEKRAAFGLRPLKELAGKRYVSLNWVDAEHAAEYQVGKKVGGKPPADKNAGGADNAQE